MNWVMVMTILLSVAGAAEASSCSGNFAPEEKSSFRFLRNVGVYFRDLANRGLQNDIRQYKALRVYMSTATSFEAGQILNCVTELRQASRRSFRMLNIRALEEPLRGQSFTELKKEIQQQLNFRAESIRERLGDRAENLIKELDVAMVIHAGTFQRHKMFSSIPRKKQIGKHILDRDFEEGGERARFWQEFYGKEHRDQVSAYELTTDIWRAYQARFGKETLPEPEEKKSSGESPGYL